ncbi:PREDICTED: uncharacterized protein LOC106751581 [Dinoponera quadriceps]|uniref:Gustatory receptor n=1 Tax=Dinoponera quadriceps TaxID=609295 RepID=A0A6P3YDK6_DINQU|nr:PREDICTED: uncharacterized protein LOC106751581 [Dinoponera quadriceps]
MKILAVPKNLSDAVAPLVIMNYLVGLRIFEYPRGKLRTVPSLIYFLLLFGIFCVCMHTQHKFYKQFQLLKLEYVLYEFMIYMYAFVVIYDMILGYFYTKMYTINISFVTVSEFSIFVKCLQMRFKLVNELLSEDAAVSTTEGMKLDLFAVEDYAKITDSKQRKNILSIKVLSHLNRQLQNRIQTCVSGKRNLVRSRTRSRLSSQLQKQLQIELQDQSKNHSKNSNSARRSIMIAECRRRTHLLQTIRQVHLELCRILKMLCTSFGIQITSEIGVSIILLTVFFYNLYILFIQRRHRIVGHCLIDESFVVIMLALTNVLKIVIINRICKHATNEIQQFGLQLSQNPVKFFTFGICLNYHVLSSCLKTVMTYMVIMIQMSNSLESSKSS